MRSMLLWSAIILGLSMFMWQIPLVIVHAQPQATTGLSPIITPIKQSTVISVNSSITAEVTNETLKAKNDILRSAVFNLLNSGPNILKTPGGDQPPIKTKIINRINNDSQNVEGIEASNAIIGVEINKALKSITSALDKSIQDGIVTIETSSICNPVKSISCVNLVTLTEGLAN